MNYKVFIQTNDEQYLGALVGAHALKRNSKQPHRFDVVILHTRDFLWLRAHVGESFSRGDEVRVWKAEDLQSFTPLRFMPPKLMNYHGRSVVIDPDCFAVADVMDLFTRDMRGKALMCRIRPGLKGLTDYRASSVMLLDNARLTHWDAEKTFHEMFQGKIDYTKWIKLEYEPDETVGYFENEWNDFDRLTLGTKILHTTYRRTQPWKAGLPIDFTVREKSGMAGIWQRINGKTQSILGVRNVYRRHPDRSQEDLFYSLLAECLKQGLVTEETVRREMAANHVRHDSLELVQRWTA
ncbi:MAG: hypothetical protein ACRERU_06090 [Methylococcales bacterium]